MAPVADPFARETWSNRSTEQDIKDKGIVAQVDWNTPWFGNAAFTSITGVRDWQTINGLDFDFTSADLLYRNADPNESLTQFETFFSERRPFFVEGTGLYQMSLNCYIVVDCSTNEGLFYSRRIGRSPSLRDRYGDDETASATPIAAATKLTGRTRSGLSFGMLDAVTQRVVMNYYTG